MAEEMKEPSAEWVESMKKKYKKVYRVVINDEVYIYRYLKRSEFKALQASIVPEMTPQGPVVSQKQGFELEDKIAQMCVLWPENYKGENFENDGASVASVLASYISNSSGYAVEEEPQAL